MNKLTFKIALTIILGGMFAIFVFMVAYYEKPGSGFYYALIAFLFVYIFFSGLAVGQNLASPVKKILNKATELSEGNLSSRVYLETKDEFAELGRVLNKIAEKLEQNRDQETNSEKIVGIKVQAKTKELEETIGALEQKVKNRTIELERLIKEVTIMQDEVKSKANETVLLRQELDDFKKKTEKYKIKKEI